jgi:DNA-binding CsgD family transcriptional regulator
MRFHHFFDESPNVEQAAAHVTTRAGFSPQDLHSACYRTIIPLHHFLNGVVHMLLRELQAMVESTADAAFAVDSAGLIVAWNAGAERLLGLPAATSLGQKCGQILQGMDECGPVCSADCTVLRSTQCHHPVNNFDLQVATPHGPQWCHVSTLRAYVANSAAPYALHIVCGIDVRKRLELLVRDFIVNEAKLPPEEVHALIATTRSSAREVELTDRELETLKLLAKGATTEEIAQQLHISHTTVNNHVQHILTKLNAHTRLEAIRRAEHAGRI